MNKKILFILFISILSRAYSQFSNNFESNFITNSSIRNNILLEPSKLSLYNETVTNTFSIPSFGSDKIFTPLRYAKNENGTEINNTKAWISAAGLTGLFIGFHYYQLNAWWKDQRGAFHVLDDPDYACKMDKVGHFYGGYLAAKLGIAGAEWIGYDKKTSAWIGAGLGSLFELYVEFEDGFGGQWGFSPSDATADLFGAFYPLLQEYYEPLKPFNLKFSYVESQQLKSGKKKIMIDDYEGQTYWLTANIYDLLPAETKKDFPDYLRWIQIAFGYGLKNYNGDFEYSGIHVTDKELYISLDYDLMKILDIDTKFFRTLKDCSVVKMIFGLLNHFHLPAPALRITFPSDYWISPDATLPGLSTGLYGKRDPKPQISLVLLGFYFSD